MNIEEYKQDIINDLAALVSYPSVYSGDEKPFGKSVKQCLHKALEIAKGYGFKTVNVDDYCGYIEMGQGEQIIGILAHLDVVPVSESWKTDPFKLTIIDDKLFGRGTTDDKGAAICSLTALRMLKPLEHTFKKRVRLILGCNEESGSAGIAYYVKKFGYVDCGFTPDGNFPLIHGEKGMIGAYLSLNSTKIKDVKGGTVSNAVANKCIVEFNDASFNQELFASFIKENGLNYTFENNVLIVNGQAAHASTPELGKNAISFTMEGLYQAGLDDELTDKYHQYIETCYHGEKLGINIEDEFGKLTFNIGLAYKQEQSFIFTIDIRCPVTFDSEKIADTMNNNGDGYIKIKNSVPSLFYPLDNPIIVSLLNAYQSVTGDTVSKPMVIGGGTYAKSMHNIVAFGCEDDVDYHIHDDNEFTTFKSIEKQIACYYQAILNLQEI